MLSKKNIWKIFEIVIGKSKIETSFNCSMFYLNSMEFIGAHVESKKKTKVKLKTIVAFHDSTMHHFHFYHLFRP